MAGIANRKSAISGSRPTIVFKIFPFPVTGSSDGIAVAVATAADTAVGTEVAVAVATDGTAVAVTTMGVAVRGLGVLVARGVAVGAVVVRARVAVTLALVVAVTELTGVAEPDVGDGDWAITAHGSANASSRVPARPIPISCSSRLLTLASSYRDISLRCNGGTMRSGQGRIGADEATVPARYHQAAPHLVI